MIEAQRTNLALYSEDFSNAAWTKTSASIGSNATILPVSICDEVVIGAGAVVTKDIKKSGTYVGNPAKRLTKKDLNR